MLDWSNKIHFKERDWGRPSIRKFLKSSLDAVVADSPLDDSASENLKIKDIFGAFQLAALLCLCRFMAATNFPFISNV